MPTQATASKSFSRRSRRFIVLIVLVVFNIYQGDIRPGKDSKPKN